MHLTEAQKKIGKTNFNTAINALENKIIQEKGISRRDLLKIGALSLAVPATGLGGFYFGYKQVADPVRVGVIGTGDEGNVLIHNMTPDYVDVVAICDIRPSNVNRAFNGDPKAMHVRQGLVKTFGYADEAAAKKKIQVYEKYQDLLDNKDVEAVIIALPLWLHADVAKAAMEKGKHVLTEKLMARTIKQCKEMARMAREKGLMLATGHQRHYNVLYENAVQIIKHGLIGDIHHIRAQWHRSNLPGSDSWSPPLPTEAKKRIEEELIPKREANRKKGNMADVERYQKVIDKLALTAMDADVNAKEYGYIEKEYAPGKTYSPLEELIRWRLWDRTGAGLMAELGSHQLDAASIFLTAMREQDKDGKTQKARPLAVTCVGGRHMFPEDRECGDHVYCTYEFPGPEMYDSITYNGKPLPGYNKEERPEKKVIVTYSSINGNGYGGWGEVVMGTQGTMILEKETDSVLFGRAQNYIQVTESAAGPVMTTSDTWEGGGGAGSQSQSRGYTEEMEHFAYCIREKAPLTELRCHPEVAMADAIIALTANISAKQQKRIEFKDEWFDIDSDVTPEADLLGGPDKLA